MKNQKIYLLIVIAIVTLINESFNKIYILKPVKKESQGNEKKSVPFYAGFWLSKYNCMVFFLPGLGQFDV